MKKYLNILLAIAVLAFASCGKNIEQEAPGEPGTDPVVDTVPEGLMLVSFKADLPEVPRATLDGGTVKWAVGDKISVWDGTRVREFSLTDGEDTASGTFEGYVTEGADEIKALFPADAECWDGSSFNFSIPDLQDVGEQSIDPRALIMTGDGSISTGISFSNAASLLRFSVGAGVERVIFHTLNGEKIAGNSTSVVVTLPGTAGTFEAAINPGEYEGIRAFITNNSGNSFLKAGASTIDLAANEGLPMGAISSDTEVIAIATPDELEAFLASSPAPALDAYLCRDLDLTSVSLSQLASYADDFDGQGHVLEHWAADAALFGTLSGSISNLTIGSSCTMGDPAPGNFGYLVNELTGSMTACVNKANIDVELADVTSSYIFGSLVGCSDAAGAVMTNCENRGDIDIDFAVPGGSAMAPVFVGGLVGKVGTESTALRMDGCENNGSHMNVDVAAGGSGNMRNIYIGGIAGAAGLSAGDSENKTGWARCYGSFDGCENNADISVTYGGGTGGAYRIGGIIGCSECALIDCINNGDVEFANNESVTSSSPAFGGIAGILCGTANPNASGCENHGALTLRGRFGNGSETWLYTEGNGGGYYSTAGGCFGYIGDSSSGISDCDNYGQIDFSVNGPAGNSSRMYMGGVAGRCVASVNGCDNLYTGTPQTMAVDNLCYCYLGGVVAVVSGGSTLGNCTNHASINMSHAMEKPHVSDKTNDPETIAGGVIGSNTGVASVSNFENSGDISLTWTGSNNDNVYYGGTMGTMNITGAAVSYCSNSGKITYVGSPEVESNVKVGGVIPRIGNAATIDHCSNTDSVKVQNSKYTAGVLAYDYYATTITDCSNSGAVSYNGRGQDSLSVWVSGIICYSNKALTIARCTNEGALHARNWAQTGANNYIGGIYGGGYATASSITDCTNTGEITVESTAKVVIGGITGSLQGNITGVTQDGDISATGSGLCMVGGIVGYHHNGNIGASAANNCSVSGTFETTCGSTCRTGGISGISHDNKAPLASTWSYITIDALVVGNEGYKGALSGGISSVAGEDHALAITLSNNTYTGTKVNGNDINADNICGSIGTGSFSGFVAP